LGDNYPAYNISWNDITDVSTGFLKKINDKNLQSDGTFRLPTEAEWEYACRAGTTTAYYWGSVFNGDYCWEYANSGGKLQPIGSVPGVTKSVNVANTYGLYDMSGNIAEWCSDWYGAYSAGSATDPTGPASGSTRIIRGNSFLNGGDYSKSGSRESISPSTRSTSAGFRLVLSAK
jgi:formylglycine-generating enzyme required for sulfatase activity